MHRYLIPALFLAPQIAWGACPAIPANCPSPTFNILTLGTPLSVAYGGTGLTSGTSGGIPGYTASGILTSSGQLTLNALIIGGGAGATPSPLASLGTTTTLLHGNASGAPSFGAVSLTADVSGLLPVANGGTGLASGTSGGILGYTAAGTLASSAALAANGLVIGGGAGVTPTAIAAGTNGQIPVGATAGPPVMKTLSGDVSAVTAAGAVTVNKIGGTAITLAAAGTFYPGHSLIGVQTFCASGCTATGGIYTADAGTNQVIIEVQAAGGGGGGCGATDGTHACVGGSGAAGSYMKGLFTSAFSGITMTVGAVGAAGTSVPGNGGTGGTTSAGSLISCPGGTGGFTGLQTATTVFGGVVGATSPPSACTNSGGTVITSVAGQRASVGFAAATSTNNQFPGQSGSTPIGEGVPALFNAATATSTGTAGTGYGWGAGGSYSAVSQTATTGLAGGPAIITVYEFN